MYKPITFLKDYDSTRYFIDENGVVFDKRFNNIVKPFTKHKNSKHLTVVLYDINHNRHYLHVDYLVYNVFKEKHNDKIFHLDNNLHNNNINNLESYYTILKKYNFLPISNNYKGFSIRPFNYYVNAEGKMFSIFSESQMIYRKDKDGYYTVTLMTTDNIKITARVHDIVLRTFKGDPPKDMIKPVVDHIDHNIHNNKISNLRWLENIDNIKNRRLDTVSGENNNNAKLTEELVEKIKSYPESVSSYTIIDELGLNISRSSINRIRTGESWAYVRPDLTIKKGAFQKTQRVLTIDEANEIKQLRDLYSPSEIRNMLDLKNVSMDTIKRVYYNKYYKDIN